MATLRSMTAFGRASRSSDKGNLTIEIQSTNRRFLEITISSPCGFTTFEPLLRKQLTSYLGRGSVSVLIKFIRNPSLKAEVRANLALARGLKEAWQEIAQTLEVDTPFSLSLLLNEKELFTQI